jgi:hypothetical protein
MPEERRPPLLIESPDDAWAVLRDITERKFEPDYYYGLEFAGWYCELMRLPEAPKSSISMVMMRSLLEFQSNITRSYKSIKYEGRRDIRLARSERQEIELDIIVLENGSRYNTDVRRALTAFFKAAADKMESKHLTILGVAVVLIIATGYFGRDAFKAYVASQAASKDIQSHAEETVKLSEEETKRAKILGALISESDQVRKAQVQVESSYRALLKGAAATGDANVLGVEIPNDLAKALITSPRRSGEGTRLDGLYEVADIERIGTGMYSAILKAPGLERPITADARALFLPDNQIDLLLSSLKTGPTSYDNAECMATRRKYNCRRNRACRCRMTINSIYRMNANTNCVGSI